MCKIIFAALLLFPQTPPQTPETDQALAVLRNVASIYRTARSCYFEGRVTTEVKSESVEGKVQSSFVWATAGPTKIRMQVKSPMMEYSVSRVFPSNVGPLAMMRPAAILQDHLGRYWVSGSWDPEVVMYDPKLDRWTMFGDAGGLTGTLHYVISGAPSLGFVASTIRESSDGKLWFAPNGYLNRYDHSVAWYDGKMWGKRAIAPEDGNEHVIGMFSDGQGAALFWVDDRIETADGQVVLRLPPAPVAAGGDNNKSGARSEILNASVDRGNRIWIATDDGLLRWDKKSRHWSDYRKIKGYLVIHQDARGRMWFGSPSGYAWMYDPVKDSWSFDNLKDHVPKGTGGLTALQGFFLQVNAIWDDGRWMAFATDRGLLAHDEKDGKWQLYTHENSPLLDDSVRALMKDDSGRLWLVTPSGVLVLEKAEQR